VNPGYICIWIALIISILLITGWKPLLAPDFNKKLSLFVIAIITLTLPFPLWWPSTEAVLQIHIAVVFLLAAAAIATFFQSVKWSTRSYLIASAVIIGTAWGLMHKMYSFDPIYHWLGPMWDAPLLAAVLSIMFSKSSVVQFSLIAWGSAIGGWLFSMLAGTRQQVLIGAWSWWDELALALLFAAALRVIIAAAAGIKNKISTYWPNNRRGGAA